jgi:hypothetical protein
MVGAAGFLLGRPGHPIKRHMQAGAFMQTGLLLRTGQEVASLHKPYLAR